GRIAWGRYRSGCGMLLDRRVGDLVHVVVESNRVRVGERRRRLPRDARRLGECPAAELGEPGRDEREVLPPPFLGDRRQDVVPQRQERTAELELSVWPGEEPQMQMGRAVAVPVHVNPGDAVERPDRALQPDG